MKNLLLLLGVFCWSLGLVSCVVYEGEKIEGNGKVTEKTYNVSNFNKIDVSGSIRVVLTQGNTYEVKTSAEENILPHLVVRVDEGELKIYQESGYSFFLSSPIEVSVQLPELEAIDLGGASNISNNEAFNVENLDLDLSGASKAELKLVGRRLNIDLSGASNIKLRGEAEEVKIDASGSSTVNAPKLLAKNVDAELSGASKATIHCTETLSVNASGASLIEYLGNPQQISQDVSGASSIKSIKED